MALVNVTPVLLSDDIIPAGGIDFNPATDITTFTTQAIGDRVCVPYVDVYFIAAGGTLLITINDGGGSAMQYALTAIEAGDYRFPGPFFLNSIGGSISYASNANVGVKWAKTYYCSYAQRGDFVAGQLPMLNGHVLVHGMSILTGALSTHDSPVVVRGFPAHLEAKNFDGAALPNPVTEGDAVRQAGTLSGVAYGMLVNPDGSVSPQGAHAANVTAGLIRQGAEAKTFDGAALPNAVAEGQDARVAATLVGVQYGMLVNPDGSVSPQGAHAANVTAGLIRQGAEAKDFDGAALPNAVAEGQDARVAATLSGIQFVMPVNEDGSDLAAVYPRPEYLVTELLNAAADNGVPAGAVGILLQADTVTATVTAFSQANCTNADIYIWYRQRGTDVWKLLPGGGLIDLQAEVGDCYDWVMPNIGTFASRIYLQLINWTGTGAPPQSVVASLIESTE